MQVIGLVGSKNTGKDTIANILCEEKGYKVIALADILKRLTMAIFDFSVDALFGESKYREMCDPRVYDIPYWEEVEASLIETYPLIRTLFLHNDFTNAIVGIRKELSFYQKNPEQVTMRYVLQRLGTDWGRAIDPDVWVRYLGGILKILEKGGHIYNRTQGLRPLAGMTAPLGVVVPDLRFLNEVKMVQDLGGTVLWADASKRVTPPLPGTHVSEPLYEDFKDVVDYIINNNGGLEDLKKQLKGNVYE
jgi:hypothetical protein